MTAKELVLKALHGEKTEIVPAGAHGWGLYKFALMGVLSDYREEKKAWNTHGMELAKIEENFQELFQPDYMHMAEAFFESKKARINDSNYAGLLAAVRRLESKQIVDEFLDMVYEDADTLGRQKKFDHLKILSEKYGDKVFIFLETEGPVHDMLDGDGVLGFALGMTHLADNPEMLGYLLEGMFKRQLEYVKAVKHYGAHGYCQSESYFGADLVSPNMYKNFLFPIHEVFYREVENMGLVPIMNFWGYLTPIAKYLKDTHIRGMLIDESRKNYVLDVGEIKQALGDEIGLFGNISSEHTLAEGSVEEVKNEVRKQIEKAGAKGGFLSCCGPPITFGTPVENVKMLIAAAHEFRWE